MFNLGWDGDMDERKNCTIIVYQQENNSSHCCSAMRSEKEGRYAGDRGGEFFSFLFKQ